MVYVVWYGIVQSLYRFELKPKLHFHYGQRRIVSMTTITAVGSNRWKNRCINAKAKQQTNIISHVYHIILRIIRCKTQPLSYFMFVVPPTNRNAGKMPHWRINNAISFQLFTIKISTTLYIFAQYMRFIVQYTSRYFDKPYTKVQVYATLKTSIFVEQPGEFGDLT